MTDPIDDFVRTGVVRYAEAQQAVSFFRERVFELLEQALKAALEDGALTLAGKPDFRRSAGEYGSQCWLSLFANVSRQISGGPRKTRLELGVWWNHPETTSRESCIVYANLRDDDPAIARFSYHPGDTGSRVRSLPAPKWTRLCVAVQEPPDLAGHATEVLAAFPAALRVPVVAAQKA
jgi:hypothetical protein